MSKFPKKITFNQRFTNAWEALPEFKGWLRAVVSEPYKAYCKVCNANLTARKKDLQDHARTDKHKMNASTTSGKQSSMRDFCTERQDGKKVNELKLAAFIAEHTAIQTCDHLCELIPTLDKNSDALKFIQMHKTKCTGLIKNVLAPGFHAELVEDVLESTV